MAVAIILALGGVWLFGGAMAAFAPLGELFLRALKMVLVPLVMLSMITGITRLGELRALGRIGGAAIMWFGVTTLAAVLLGLALVVGVAPGAAVGAGALTVPERVAAKAEVGLADVVLGLLSDNLVRSMVDLQILPLIVFSLAFGLSVSTLGQRGRPLGQALEVADEAMMRLVHALMVVAPVGVFGLVAGRFGKAVASGGVAGLFDSLRAVGAYAGVVLAGLAIHAVVVLPLAVRLRARRSPWALARASSAALLSAFSTASSSATMPLTLQGAEERAGIDARVARLVIPLGATVNMNGTALYEAVAAIFIAQSLGIELGGGQLVLIAVTATLAAIGAAGIPEAGLVTMVMVLRAVDLPLEGIELILAVDWLLDRFRTVVNVWGDVAGAAVVEAAITKPGASSARVAAEG